MRPGEIITGGGADTERIRWGRDLEPAWLFLDKIVAPIHAGDAAGGINLQPNEIGYLFGYQVSTTSPAGTNLVLTIASTPEPTVWTHESVSLGGMGSIQVTQDTPIAVFYPVTTYNPLAFIVRRDELHVGARWQIFDQVGFLYATEEVRA